MCLGSPLGLNNTTTVGVVSNLERTSGESGWDWMGLDWIGLGWVLFG